MQLRGMKKQSNEMKINRFSNTLISYKKNSLFFLMLLPAIIYFVIFHYLPMYGVTIAFKDYYILKGILGSKWVGFKHFEDVFSGLFFWPVFKNTLIISFYKLMLGFFAPIVLAIMLNEVSHNKYKKVVQSITYLPHFMSWVVLSGLLIEILSPSRGPVNILLQGIGLEPIYFIAEKSWFRSILVGSSIWKEAGWSSIIYLAAISGIDPQMYEVAELDGASRMRKIWNITIPSIMPVIIIMFIFATGKIIQDDFEQVYNLLNPAVMEVGDVISTYTYREGLERMNYSYAAAVGLFKNVISFALVMGTNYIARRTSDYALW
ncbi:ABC transporter permease [Vallitalea okinawensis]|uniref:ABC transporter permease n=1 Tax=Vallitalea okinawensis TaxID=2078660 RepID=UPI001FA88E93|nr:ABC transporter permease subunit [Vallitalea okinawensis]